ncbi:hypothetical protein DL95DRAFT_482630 [Leptodontidium sp. 2 PMI_412]|nr:hypothetical protein DL95DRAFT_482630 [Leptodontidium sp. 2 PMI_412]
MSIRVQCLDPQDRISGLLGLATDSKILVLQPDYAASVATVYAELVLVRAGKGDDGKKPIPYSASKRTFPIINISADLITLSSRGLFIATVDGLGHASNTGGSCFELIQSTEEPNPTRFVSYDGSSLMEEMARSLLCKRYQKRPMLPDFSLRCFDEITLRALHIIKDYKSFFPEWFQYNKCFLIHGCSLEDWVHDWMACCSAPSADEGVSADAKLYTLDAAATMYYYRKRLMTTREGGFGMAPHNSQPGDEVWVLFGCSVPVVHPASGMSLLGRVMPMELWTGRRLPSMRKKRGRRGQ